MDAITLGALQRLQYPQFSTSPGLTANSGGVQSGATLCANSANVFTTVGGSGYSGILPKAIRGRELVVINAGANPLALFPAVGDAIDGLGANAALTVPVGGNYTFFCTGSGQWYSDANPVGSSFAGVATGAFSATSNTTLANVTGLVTTLQSGASYSIWGYHSVSANASGGLKLGCNGGTATATLLSIDTWAYSTTTTAAQTNITALSSNLVAYTGAVSVVEFTGFIKVNAGGTFQMQAAQNASFGTATTIANGSFVQFTRLA